MRAGRGEPGALVVDGDRIASLGPESDGPTAAVSVDLGGRWVVPGFVDPHVHLAFSSAPDALERLDTDGSVPWVRAVGNAERLLAAGVTTAADCGGPGHLNVRLRDAVVRGEVRGPRLLASVNPITRTGGHCAQIGLRADDRLGVESATRRVLEAGADFVKVMASGGGTVGDFGPWEPQYTASELRAAVEVAHAAGRRVVAHARGTEAIRRAVAAGADVLAHLTWETADGYAYDADTAAAIRERRVWVDPTLPAGYQAARSERVAPERRDALRAHFGERYPLYRRLAREAGVRLLCGSDAGTPLVAMDEFALGPKLLVEVAGYSPAEALRAATVWGAEALGVADSRGTLESGKLADLVLLDADPLADVAALRRIAGVMVGGKWAVEPPACVGQQRMGAMV